MLRPTGLIEVLDAIGEAETDSDEDGTSDFDELRALTDPNNAQDADLACDAPSDDDRSCAASAPGGQPSGARSALFVTAVFVVLLATVRRRRLA